MASRPATARTGERRPRLLAEALAQGREALRRQAARNAGCPEDAEDALQDACLEFLRYYEGPAGADAVRYLMVAVKRCAWALGERAARRYASDVQVTSTDAFVAGEARVAVLCERAGPHQRAWHRERHRALARDLLALKADERAAISLLALGFSYREIAKRKDWTQTKVNRCLAEGRGALRALPVARGRSSPSG